MAKYEKKGNTMQEHHENIFYAVNEKILVLDTQLRVMNASPAFYKAFNVKPGDTLDRQLVDLGTGQWNIPELLAKLTALIPAGGEFSAFEDKIDFPDGAPRSMMLSALRSSRNGKGEGAIMLAIDEVPDHLHAFSELAAQRARFEIALNTVADGIIVTNADATVTFVNPIAERLTGWTQKEALNKQLGDVFNIVDDRLHKPVECPVPRAIREGPIVGLAGLSILVARDGTQWPIDDSATPIEDVSGKVIGVVITFRTTTNRRRNVKRLEISEVRYRRLFETAHDGILILDASTGKVLDVNRYLLELLHFPAEHFLGKELWEIGVLHDKEANKAAMTILKDRGSIRYEDLPLEDKNGKCIPVEFVSNVYREGDRDVIQCNIRNITERRHVEKKN
jgi:PAS domain S-box-containing protein